MNKNPTAPGQRLFHISLNERDIPFTSVYADCEEDARIHVAEQTGVCSSDLSAEETVP